MPSTTQLVTYSSKLLLFGEYSIIHGGAGLSVPISQFSGHWDYKPGVMEWNELFNYLSEQEWSVQIEFNKAKLKSDVTKGLFFNSNIPQGFGLGSSAAITAAIFDVYFIKKEQLSIGVLHHILAQIESHFHGESSGLDPLVSYLNHEVLIHAATEKKAADIELVNCSSNQSNYQLFLYNTGMPRNTKKLVAIHKDNYENDPAYRKYFVVLNEMNQRAISFLRSRDVKALRKEFEAISSLQLELLIEMIPAEIQEDFKTLKLKLCGAGGGGYFLGICLKKEFPELKSNYPIIEI